MLAYLHKTFKLLRCIAVKLRKVKSLAIYSGGNGHKIKLECHFYVETKNIAHFCCRNNAFALGVKLNTQNSNLNHLTRTLELSFTSPISRVETDVSDVPVQFVRRSQERENTVAWLWKRENTVTFLWETENTAARLWKSENIEAGWQRSRDRQRLGSDSIFLSLKPNTDESSIEMSFCFLTLEFLFLVCVISAASFLLLVCSFHKLIIDCNVRWICL